MLNNKREENIFRCLEMKKKLISSLSVVLLLAPNVLLDSINCDEGKCLESWGLTYFRLKAGYERITEKWSITSLAEDKLMPQSNDDFSLYAYT